MRKKIKQEQDDFVAKMKEQGIEVIGYQSLQNPFKRFWQWLSSYIPRDICHFFHERKMRKLKLGTVCWKDNELKTIKISWDIHWMSNVYLAAIIRDYLRFFIKNTPAIDEMFRRWEKIVNDTADLFDELVKSVEIEETNEDYQKKVNVAFDALKEIFYDLEW